MAQDNYVVELKKQICDMVKDGRRLSQSESRKLFSQYLSCILKRITTTPDQDGHIDMIIKFLQKAARHLKTPFLVKVITFFFLYFTIEL